MATNAPTDLAHPGWSMLARRLGRRLSRRAFLPGSAAALAGTSFGVPFLTADAGLSGVAQASSLPDLANWPTATPIKHIVVLCQENRSFDHYFGAFAASFGRGGDRALGFDPQNLTYYNTVGIGYHPEHIAQYCDTDPDHSWEGSHAKWNRGRMDGSRRSRRDNRDPVQSRRRPHLPRSAGQGLCAR